MRRTKFFVAGLVIALLVVAGTAGLVAAAPSTTAPTGWCDGGIPWEVPAGSVNTPLCPEVPTAVTIYGSDPFRYTDWWGANAKRNGQDATFWAEPVVQVKSEPTDEAEAPVVQAASKNYDRTDSAFCRGNREWVFDHQVLNEDEAPCGADPDKADEFYRISPWRDGGPYHPGEDQWGSWRQHVRYIKSACGPCTNGSFWRKPQVVAVEVDDEIGAPAPSTSARVETRVQLAEQGIPWWAWLLVAIGAITLGALAFGFGWLAHRAASPAAPPLVTPPAPAAPPPPAAPPAAPAAPAPPAAPPPAGP